MVFSARSMKFSILISNYNKDRFIEECIISSLNQDYKNLEIIIFDNKSTDNSLNIINKYSNKILVKSKSRISKVGPENQIDLLLHAFKLSTGDIICLLDGDDFFLKDKVKKIKDVFSKNKKTDVVFDIPRIKKNNKLLPIKLKSKINKKIWPSTIPTSGISFRRNFFEYCVNSNLFKFNPTLEIDFRLSFFVQNIHGNFIILDDYLTFYRKVSDGVMSGLSKYSFKWWIKRNEAHNYITSVYSTHNIKYKKGLDYYLTNLIIYFFRIIK